MEIRTVPWQKGTLAILTDTERHRLVQREIKGLAEREKEARDQARAHLRFRELLEAAPDAMVVVDQAGDFRAVRDRAEQVHRPVRGQ